MSLQIIKNYERSYIIKGSLLQRRHLKPPAHKCNFTVYNYKDSSYENAFSKIKNNNRKCVCIL